MCVLVQLVELRQLLTLASVNQAAFFHREQDDKARPRSSLAGEMSLTDMFSRTASSYHLDSAERSPY